ncbi:ethanolamine utilization protein EutJ [Micropruina sonneratiae]|uniref:ethanolamine utilization protein EutJ n=1 Tax=Micropruina sonneratiae TaxID=2986940 RepID=UPI0022272E0D|nr:ethanolamine utilization protein EutJ [Micropruina sp. KQZ13P-5]MCW3157264.1 ethanolamine utilization protein EutJ [Micropruina sp. KQZ13P-5]
MTPAIKGIEAPEAAIRRFAELVRSGAVDEPAGEPRLGIDLGTANIVVSVVDAANRPVAGDWAHSTVVRDGVVVDWAGATSAVRRLTHAVESRLGHRFASASVSVPPGISDGDTRVFRNVAGAAGLDVDEVVDEPVAAARALGISDGCVIDIGHGTTGVSVLSGGRTVLSVDEATGGHHMSLVLAGAYRIEYEAAEAMKKDPARRDDVVGVIRPTLEKMASIAADALAGIEVDLVYLVGGSSSFPNAPDVFAGRLGRPVVRPAEPLFVTPLGIPMRVVGDD